MRPPLTMEATIGKRRYRVASSTLIAHDCYWDGSGYERHGRNVFLYRTPTGRYFMVRLSQWQGERDVIDPLDVEAAYALYERLPEKELPPELAFPQLPIQEA